MSNELKPCPCCGGEAILRRHSHREFSPNFSVQCQYCRLSTTTYKIEAIAAIAWNRRTSSDHIVDANKKEPDNPPLTLEELRDLAGKEPVYAVSRADKGQWCVIDTAPRFGGGTAVIAIYGRGLTLGGDDYGDSWLAYRRKPEEE